MKEINRILFRNGTKEELLPDFAPDFPYLASRVELERCIGRCMPWHWHKEVEIFYLERGIVEYNTPKGSCTLPAGSGGFVNSNVLHMTRAKNAEEPVIQLNHIFDVSLVGGQPGSRIEQKYISPLISASQIEILPFYPDVPEHACLLEGIRRSFQLDGESYDYEISLRNALSELWCGLLEAAKPMLEQKGDYDKADGKLKEMMSYINDHYTEKLTVSEIAASAFVSERECFRTFQECLRTTPMEYLKSCRIQRACFLLAGTNEPITNVGHACGLGSSSYFGKLFREYTGLTPLQYRRHWQDYDTIRQK